MNVQKKVKLLFQCFFGDEKAVRESRYTIFSILAKKMLIRLYNKDLMWSDDDEFVGVWSGFPESGNSITHERRFNLYYLSKSVERIDGDTAECGVFKGASSYLILKANASTRKEHYIFDSFEGLSEIESNDVVTDSKIAQWSKNDLSVEEDIVRKNLNEFSNVHYLKGWIPERFGEVKDKKYSFAHIDVDLYQPTLDSVKYFYERMVNGGIIVCDDYGFKTCPGAYKAINEFFADKPENVIHLTTGQGL